MPVLPDTISTTRLAFDGARTDDYLAVVADEERERLASFGSEKRRHEHLLGRVALRQLVAARTGQSPREVALHVPEGGWVEVGLPACWVSVSHSGDQAFAALASHPVGVDIEVCRTVRPDLHRFLLHPDEYGWLEHWGDAYDDTLVRLWSIKEAVLKARRTGFRMSPKKIRVQAIEERWAHLSVGKERWTVGYGLDTHAWAVAWPAHHPASLEGAEVSQDG